MPPKDLPESKDPPESSSRTSENQEQFGDRSIGEPRPPGGKIVILDYDPRWPELFEREADRIRLALGPRALQVEHVGSTSVPGLAAKPVIDIVLAVADSADEESYVPLLEDLGYVLRIRESNWHEHRMLKGLGDTVNLHVFSLGCKEIGRMLAFRDWLRHNPRDRDLYARAKLELAERKWQSVQDYADAKTAVIRAITRRAGLKLQTGSTSK